MCNYLKLIHLIVDIKMSDNWEPPFSLEERIKYSLIPASLYMYFRSRKEFRRGEPELALIPFMANPARVSLDIGANKGIYSWVLRNYSLKVYAFEPNPKMYRVLRRIESDKISVFQYALSNESGNAILCVPGNEKDGFSNQHSSLSAVNISENYNEVEVLSRRLDELEISNVGFIKIDVEGFEHSVLEGAEETINRDKPTLLIEMEERHTKQPIESSIDYVESLGYRGLFLKNGNLSSIVNFDGDKLHRQAVDTENYVYNFIFLPK